MSLRILFILLFSISLTNSFGQQLTTPADIDKLINNIDSARLKTIILSKDSASGFLIDETVYVVDETGKLINVKHSSGNHPGKVSGHLVRQSTYYFKDDTLIKVNQKSYDFAKLLNSINYYFTTPKRKEMNKREYKLYIEKSKSFILKYQSYIKTHSG